LLVSQDLRLTPAKLSAAPRVQRLNYRFRLAVRFIVLAIAVLFAIGPLMIATAEDAPTTLPQAGATARPRLLRSMQDVYLIDRGKRRWIANPQVFTDHRLQETWIEDISDDTLNRTGLGPDLVVGPILRGSDGRTWIVYQGSRHYVIAPDAFPPLALSPTDAVDVTDAFLEGYPVGRAYGNRPSPWPLAGYLFAVFCVLTFSLCSPAVLHRYHRESLEHFMCWVFIGTSGLLIFLRGYFVSMYPRPWSQSRRSG
jgi:hypothetical protein